MDIDDIWTSENRARELGYTHKCSYYGATLWSKRDEDGNTHRFRCGVAYLLLMTCDLSSLFHEAELWWNTKLKIEPKNRFTWGRKI